MINLDKVSEGVDYELIPVEYVDNEAAWDVRILRGELPKPCYVLARSSMMENAIVLPLTFV